MHRQNRFHKLFCFCEDIGSQSLKIVCPRSQQLHGHTNFSLDTDIFILLIKQFSKISNFIFVTGYFLVSIFYFFLSKIISGESAQLLTLLARSVWVVVDYTDMMSVQLLTMLTRSPHSRWLCWQGVCVVVDHADIMLA